MGGLAEDFRGEGVGDVEREIADADEFATVFVVIERGEVAEKKAIGFGAFDEFQVSDFAGL